MLARQCGGVRVSGEHVFGNQGGKFSRLCACHCYVSLKAHACG